MTGQTIEVMQSDFLPPGWRRIPSYFGVAAFEHKTTLLRVLASVQVYHDKNAWLHVSMSHHDRLPTYEEMQKVKDVFVGRNNKAIQVFSPASEHVNVHPYCLHLWHCITANPIPDFRFAGMI